MLHESYFTAVKPSLKKFYYVIIFLFDKDNISNSLVSFFMHDPKGFQYLERNMRWLHSDLGYFITR